MKKEKESVEGHDVSIELQVTKLSNLVKDLDGENITKKEFVKHARGILTDRFIRHDIQSAEIYSELCNQMIGENDEFGELNSIINVACCCIDVARHYKSLPDDMDIHPMWHMIDGRPDALLKSVTDLLAWTQKTLFPRDWPEEGLPQDDSDKKSNTEREYMAKLKGVLSGHNELSIETIKKALDTLDVHYNHNTENNEEVGK